MRVPRSLLAILGLVAACHPVATGTAVVSAPASAWSPWPGLVDVGCEPSGARCVGLDAAGLWQFQPSQPAARTQLPTAVPGASGLTVLDGGLAVEVPCADLGRCARSLAADGALGDPVALPMQEPGLAPTSDLDQDGQAAMFARQFSRAAAGGGRVGFYRLVIAPDQARVALMPGSGGTLIHSGHGIRAVRLGTQDAASPWPATLSLHPSGQELYVLAWPDGTLRALDPLTLAPHWTLPLDAPAYGLYLDGAGRYLIGQLASLDSDDTSASAALARIDAWPEPDGRTDDPALRDRDAPPATATFAVDLALKQVAAALPGRLRRSLAVGPDLLLATSEAVQLVRTPELQAAPAAPPDPGAP